jgi:hypothetical protein
MEACRFNEGYPGFLCEISTEDKADPCCTQQELMPPSIAELVEKEKGVAHGVRCHHRTKSMGHEVYPVGLKAIWRDETHVKNTNRTSPSTCSKSSTGTRGDQHVVS